MEQPKVSLKRIFWIAGIAVFGAFIAWSFRPIPVRVEISAVGRAEFIDSVTEDGKTRVKERFTVSAPIAGNLERISLKAGDRVSKGDVLAVVAPVAPALLDARTRQELKNRAGAAEANLYRMRASEKRSAASVELARIEYERIRRLAETGDISTQELDRARIALNGAEQELEAANYGVHAAEHELEMAQAAYRITEPGKSRDTIPVRSPLDGVVLRVIHESEGVVGSGEPLLELADAGSLEIVVDVLTTDAVRFPENAEVIISGWGGPKDLQGRLRRVEPAGFTKISSLGVEEQRVNALVDIVSPHDDWRSLSEGFRVFASFVISRTPGALVTPVGSLFREGAQWVTFDVENGKARKRRVEASRSNDKYFLVESGLTEGERVVVYPPSSLNDGDRVEEIAAVR